MQISNPLPKNFEKTIGELARSREKSARQKFLLDLGESLVMHLCAFVLGEYKHLGIACVELESSFLTKKNNISFGVYLMWLREASKFLNSSNHPSKIHNLLHGNNELDELSQFNKMFETLKSLVKEEREDYSHGIGKTLENQLGKTNFMVFFDKLVEFRNRIAHPHKEIKGKIVVWPFTEGYFDATNPYLEKSLMRCINELNLIWEFQHYIVDSNEDGLLVLKDEGTNVLMEIETHTELMQGSKVFAHQDQTVLLSDWKLLLKAGEEAVEHIRREEEKLRNKATLEHLSIAIQDALADEQISVQELQFFESLGSTKLGLSKKEIKAIILDIAAKEGIENPFPEVDKRLIELVDHAIVTRTYNEFVLKLTAQQYGIDNDAFETLFTERTFILNVDPEEVRKNKVFQMSLIEMKAYQDLMRAQQWIYSIGVYSQSNKDSQYKIQTGNADVFGTKEYWHKTSFLAVERYVKQRIEHLAQDPEVWKVNMNQWQQGNLSGYAWCSIYHENSPAHKLLALDLAINNRERLSGDVMVGFLADWKDFSKVENPGLLNYVFKKHLLDFAAEYRDEIEKYPNLLMWDTSNFRGNYSLHEITTSYEWFITYLYYLDEIQFVIPMAKIIENPTVVQEMFDISFNLFSGLFAGVIRDYENLLSTVYTIQSSELEIKSKLAELYFLFERYGLIKLPTDAKTLENSEMDNEMSSSTDDFNGSGKVGVISTVFKVREESFPLIINFSICQDYLNDGLFYRIYVGCAGYIQPKLHGAVEKVLESMQDLSYEHASFHFMRSKLVAILPITALESFNPVGFTEYFLNEFSSRCAFSYTSFQGLRIHNEQTLIFEPQANFYLNQLGEELATGLKNKISKERNWMKGYRFLDYVSASSSKTCYHWLGWGLSWQQGKVFGGVIFHISNSLTGAIFKEQMEVLSDQLEWKLQVLGNAEHSESYWVGHLLGQHQFKTSSDFNRNYTGKHAVTSNEKTCWRPAQQNENQWIQIELTETMEIHKLKLMGSPNNLGAVSSFHFTYSTDGKNWNRIEHLTGLSQFSESKEIPFNQSINARYIRLIPVEFIQNIALRLDIFVRKIVPSKMELQWFIPLNSVDELEDLFKEIPRKVSEIKAFQSIGF